MWNTEKGGDIDKAAFEYVKRYPNEMKYVLYMAFVNGAKFIIDNTQKE